MLNGVTIKTSNKATEALTLPNCNKCCPDCGRQFVQLPGGRGDSHMKQTGMLVVSLRGVNFGFWSRLGCPAQSANILRR